MFCGTSEPTYINVGDEMVLQKSCVVATRLRSAIKATRGRNIGPNRDDNTPKTTLTRPTARFGTRSNQPWARWGGSLFFSFEVEGAADLCAWRMFPRVYMTCHKMPIKGSIMEQTTCFLLQHGRVRQREPELTALATASARRRRRSPEPPPWPGYICTKKKRAKLYT